jgi:hypothetical protein
MEILHVYCDECQSPSTSENERGGVNIRVGDSFPGDSADDDDDNDNNDNDDDHLHDMFATTYSLSTDALTTTVSSWYECLSSSASSSATATNNNNPDHQTTTKTQSNIIQKHKQMLLIYPIKPQPLYPSSSIPNNMVDDDNTKQSSSFSSSRCGWDCSKTATDGNHNNKRVRFSSSPPCVMEYEQPSIQWYGDLFYGPSEMQEFWNDAMHERQQQQQQQQQEANRRRIMTE